MFSYKSISKDIYINSQPYPNIELNNMWDDQVLTKCSEEINNFEKWDGEKNFFAAKKRSYSSNYKNFPKTVKTVFDELCSQKFINWLETFTGEKKLIADKNFEAGGISSIGKSGFLKIHADPNYNPKLKLYRKIVIIIYLNENWKNEWGGALELWDKDMSKCIKKIFPQKNNMIIFSSNGKNFHGNPDPLACPLDIRRKNLIMYYYSPIKDIDLGDSIREDGSLSLYKERFKGEFKYSIFLNRIKNRIKKFLK